MQYAKLLGINYKKKCFKHLCFATYEQVCVKKSKPNTPMAHISACMNAIRKVHVNICAYFSIFLSVNCISSCAQQKDRKLTRCSGGKALFCQFDTYFNLFPIYQLYVLFVEIPYQARFCLQKSYPAILFTMLIEFCRIHPSAGNKQSSAVRKRSRPSAWHPTI